MGEWREKFLSDLAILYKDSWKVGDEECPYIALEHIEEGKLRLNGIGHSDIVASNKYRFNEKNFLFGKLRPYFRKVVRPQFSGICSTDIWVVGARCETDLTFLFYLFANQEFVDLAYSGSSGTRMPRADWKFMKDTTWLTPSDIEEQQAIASVLSSLDDKIDLLHRQNKTLEAMAETLFRQWFVDSNTNSYYTFEELVDSVSVKHSLPKETIIFLNTSDIYDGHVLNHNYSEVKALPGQAKKSIKKGDILFTEIRPANRRFAYIDFDAEKYVVSTKLMVLRSKDVLSRSIMFFFLKTQETLNWLQMLAEARSGTFPQITFDDFKALEIYVPSGTKLPELAGLFDSIFEKTFKNQSQIRTLEKLRDTLLPKLMSCEVRVMI